MASRPRAVRTGRAAAQLGAQLAALREHQDLSVDQLAERSHLSRATVRRVENGDPSVGLGTLDPGNFHRKVLGSAGFVRRTDDQRTSGRGRPAATFTTGDAFLLHPPILQRTLSWALPRTEPP